MRWIRPSWLRRDFELRSGETLVATLSIRGAFRPVGIVESGEGGWTIARTGWLQTHATIRARGASTDAAAFSGSAWTGCGELALASGRRFGVAVNVWLTRLEVRSESGEPLVIIHKRGWCGRNAEVETAPEARTMRELPLLVTYGWFHLVMLEQDAASVVVTG